MARADIVICGAGMAGVAAAWHLAARRKAGRVVLVDPREPLTLTSDKGTEAYRNWWPGPGPAMVRLVDRSIDLLEAIAERTENRIGLNRRGYVFLTADAARVNDLEGMSQEIADLGAGELRRHGEVDTYDLSPDEGYADVPRGADLVLDRDWIRRRYPFVSENVLAMLHTRRCGWFDAAALGRWLLDELRAHGGAVLRDEVVGIDSAAGRVAAVRLRSGERLVTETFVSAAGPYTKRVAALAGEDLPLTNELHCKVTLVDEAGIVPRNAPLMVWADPITLDWSDAERARLADDPAGRPLLDALPPGAHFRPCDEGGRPCLRMLWPYHAPRADALRPRWPPRFDPWYGEAVVRGLTRMIPGLEAYAGLGATRVDGGYYCKTPENRPLAGPLALEGAFVIGGLGGFGLMASQGAAELLAAHVTKEDLPEYAPWFHPARYATPEYRRLLDDWDPSEGEL